MRRRALVLATVLALSLSCRPSAASVSSATAIFDAEAQMSFDFEEADVADVLRLLAEAGGFSLVAGEDVGGAVTLRFDAANWEEAIEVIAAAAGLVVERSGDVVRVATTDGRIAAVDAQRRLRDAREGAAAVVTMVLPMRHADSSAVAALLSGDEAGQGGTGSLLSERGLLFAEPTTNVVFIADTAERVERIAAIVADLDRPPVQVMIESEIVETSSDASLALGIQWGYRGLFGSTTAEDGSTHPDGEVSGDGVGENRLGVPFIASFPVEVGPQAGSALDVAWGAFGDSQALAVRLSALEREGEARVVSRPRVVTLNNVPATIKSLTVIRVKLPSTDTLVRTDDAPGIYPSAATEKIETGIVLVVTPRVAAGDQVVLDLFVKSSQADFSREVDGIPTETSREATSRVVVGDGETVVLGGIYADVRDRRESGVPFLRSLPGLGWFFRGTERADRREDLLVFITPRILGRVPLATVTAEAVAE